MINSYPHLQFKYEDAGRDVIIKAVDLNMKFYKDEKPVIGHSIPPRTGKTAIIHLTALEAKEAGAPFVHCFVPWKNLADQTVSKVKINTTLERAVVEGYDRKKGYRAQHIEAINSTRYWKSEGVPYTLMTSTIHLAHFNKRELSAATQLAYEETGKRPVIIVDEVHLLKQGEVWASTLYEFESAGAFVVTLTGTKDRCDSACIPGFYVEEKEGTRKTVQYKVVESQETSAFVDVDGLLLPTKKINKGSLRDLDLYKAEIKPLGLDIPWRISFENEWMHSMEALPQDFEVVLDEENKLLSECSDDLLSKNFSRWVRSAECCRRLAQAAVTELSVLRSTQEQRKTKLLVVTTSDLNKDKEDKSSNVHAREMRRHLQTYIELDPVLSKQDLAVEICTSVDDEGNSDESTKDKLRRFGLSTVDRNGSMPIDILIVKGMGIVGLDVPECKILVDATTLKVGPLKRQLAARPLTVWKTESGLKARPASVIYPYTRDNHTFYSSLKETSQVTITEELKRVEFEEEVDTSDNTCTLFDLEQDSGRSAGILDEGGNWLDGNFDSILRKINNKYPATKTLPKLAVLDMWREEAFKGIENEEQAEPPVENSFNIIDSGAELQEERDKETFGAKAQRLVGTIISFKENPDQCRKWLTRLQYLAKQRCGVSPDQPVGKINDVEKLKQLKAALDSCFSEMKGGMRK